MERRKYARIKKTLTVQYSHKDKEKWDMSIIKDISETGICIATNKNFPLTEIINFRIKMPSEPFQWLELYGKVVECEEVISGTYITRAEFIYLEVEQKKIIKAYIAWVLGKGGKK
jgi:c-di-GMP-binding flagellar brake protein YcgR